MKTHFFSAVTMTLATFVLLVVIYPLLVWGAALVAPAQGRGETVEFNGRVVGFAQVGQKFANDAYFWSRPSAIDYNAAGSGGSNKGPSNAEYLAQVQARIDTFLVHNPSVKKADIPVEVVTASGSGLDPDLSPKAAYVQVARIANLRHLSENQIKTLIQQHTDAPLFGLFGPKKVNILALNIALDKMK